MKNITAMHKKNESSSIRFYICLVPPGLRFFATTSVSKLSTSACSFHFRVLSLHHKAKVDHPLNTVHYSCLDRHRWKMHLEGCTEGFKVVIYVHLKSLSQNVGKGKKKIHLRV